MLVLCRRVLLCCVLCWLGTGCGSGVPKSRSSSPRTLRQSVIYGQDDRTYTDEHADAQLRKLADSVAVMLASSRVTQPDSNVKDVFLTGVSLTKKIETSSDYDKKPLCTDEPFQNDPAPGSCTGFLIGPKHIMTAGHCIAKTEKLSAQEAQSWCNQRAVVFGFRKGRQLTTDDVYRCHRVLVHRYTEDTKASQRYDIAVFELTKEVQGHTPLTLDYQPNLQKDEGLAIIGYPHGTWQKIAAGGKVYDPRSQALDYFTSNLDTMPGNSGSPVFSLNNYKVIGVHVRGARPVYKVDAGKGCNKSHVITEDKGGQSENYLESGKAPPCQTDNDCEPRHTCENGLCHFRTTDLQITALTLSQPQGKKDQTITATFTIQNVGTYDITTSFRVSLWWSTNKDICVTCGKDVRLNSVTIQSLAAGKTFDGTMTFQVNTTFQDGKQSVGLFLDDFKDSSQQDSYTGNIAELNEDNNEKSLPFTLITCTDACQKDALRCQGSDVEKCVMQSTGCLGWSQHTTCKAPETCVQGACKKTCTDTCTQEGEKRCQGKAVERCEKAASGCLAWQASQTCTDKEECKQGACVAQPKATGESCQTHQECQSQVCQGVCTTKCQQSSDCKDAARPYCEQGACVPLPQGVCLQDTDCGQGKSCQQSKCLESSAHPAKPEGGCQCQNTPHPSPAGPGLFFLLAFLWRRQQARRCSH